MSPMAFGQWSDELAMHGVIEPPLAHPIKTVNIDGYTSSLGVLSLLNVRPSDAMKVTLASGDDTL